MPAQLEIIIKNCSEYLKLMKEFMLHLLTRIGKSVPKEIFIALKTETDKWCHKQEQDTGE